MMDPNNPHLTPALPNQEQLSHSAENALNQAAKDQISDLAETALNKATDVLPQEQQKQAQQVREGVQKARQGVQKAQSMAQMMEQMAAIRKKNQEQAHLPVQPLRPTPMPPPAQQDEPPAPIQQQQPSLAALESIYEKTVWQIRVGGKPIQRVVSFQLEQGFNGHHTFQLCVYHAELEEPRAYRIDQTKDLLGRNLTAILGSHLQDDRVEFTGIITGVAFHQANGLNGEVIITGSSPTILLDSGPHLNAFYNQDLAAIARQLTQMLSGKLELAIQPRYTQPLPYAAQYGESSFAFLNRLASWYGEWFFFNGRKLCLGRPDRTPHYKLYYARQLEDLQMQMQAVPMNFSHLSYVSSSDTLMKQSAGQRVDGLNFYGDLAVEKSDQLFAPVRHKPLQQASTAGSFAQATQVNKSVAASGAFTLKGTCKSPYLTPGCRITIFIGETELGQFLITSVSHTLLTGDHYTSTFTAVGGNVHIIPTPVIPSPLAQPELGVVKKNDDPDGQGRVRVQLHWQEQDTMTDWIQVMSPDGGSSEKVAKNRGFVFIPEVGDLVMVGYRDGNCDAPFVLGSLPHGQVSGGGGKGNKTKSLTSRSGSTVTLDDEKGSVRVADKDGNHVVIDGAGKITVESKTHIELKCGLSVIAMDDKGNITISGKAIAISGTESAGMVAAPATPEGQEVDGSGLSLTPSEANLIGKTTATVGAGDKATLSGTTVEVVAKGETSVQGSKVNIN